MKSEREKRDSITASIHPIKSKISIMRNRFILTVLLLCFAGTVSAKDYKVSSPDGRITVLVTKEEKVSWIVTYDGKEVLRF